MSFAIHCPHCKKQIGNGHVTPKPDGAQHLSVTIFDTEIPHEHAQYAPQPPKPQEPTT